MNKVAAKTQKVSTTLWTTGSVTGQLEVVYTETGPKTPSLAYEILLQNYKRSASILFPDFSFISGNRIDGGSANSFLASTFCLNLIHQLVINFFQP